MANFFHVSVFIKNICNKISKIFWFFCFYCIYSWFLTFYGKYEKKLTRKFWEFQVFLWMLCKRVYQNSILGQYRPRKTYFRPLIATKMSLLQSNLEWPLFVYTINFEIRHYIIFSKPLIDVDWRFFIKHFTTCYVQKFQFM